MKDGLQQIPLMHFFGLQSASLPHFFCCSSLKMLSFNEMFSTSSTSPTTSLKRSTKVGLAQMPLKHFLGLHSGSALHFFYCSSLKGASSEILSDSRVASYSSAKRSAKVGLAQIPLKHFLGLHSGSALHFFYCSSLKGASSEILSDSRVASYSSAKSSAKVGLTQIPLLQRFGLHSPSALHFFACSSLNGAAWDS